MNRNGRAVEPDLDAIANVGRLGFDGLKSALADLAARGGPKLDEYDYLTALMDRISDLRASGQLTDGENDQLLASVGEASSPESLMGFIYHRPHGYAGDFEIIQKLYANHVSDRPFAVNWDHYIQSLHASKAVRNRKEVLAAIIQSIAESQSRPVKMVNVGSGPCHDLLTALENKALLDRVHCIDLDQRAIDHAKSLLTEHLGRITFVRQNALRLKSRDEFDLAWSAGLFDYLDDRQFKIAMRAMYTAVRPGGQVVIGNFGLNNPSRSAMEWPNWKLIHRSDVKLRALVNDSGLATDRIEVMAEPEGVNLFLRVWKSK